MRSFGKWLGRLVLALALASLLVGFSKREEITRLLAVNSLFKADRIVRNFSHMDAAFLSAPVARGNGPTTALDHGPETTLPAGVDGWAADRGLTALVVLHKSQIVHEAYFKGTTAEDKRISWSVAKSYLSALVGILLDEGVIASLDDPVVKYVPALAEGAYATATLRHVLGMTSGVTFDEDILDKKSDINRMGRVLALGGEMDLFAQGLTDNFAVPGSTWKYVSIDTHIVGMVVRGASGRNIAELLSEKVIVPMGLEYAPYYLTDGVGTAFVLGGLNLTARDYARFGQMYAQNGFYNGRQIVPADWVAASTAPTAPTDPGTSGYGLHWWAAEDPAPGEFLARGAYGQYIYVDQTRDVVIVVTAADLLFNETGRHQDNMKIFRQIAAALNEDTPDGT